MYVCGMTVYDYCHIGHARVMVVFDMVQRWLRARGFERHLCAQHHRHRRQDHQARGRERRTDRGADRPLHRGDARRRRRARRRSARPRAARDRIHAADARHDRHARSKRLRLSGAQTATSITRCASSPATASFRGKSLDDLRAGERVDVDDGKRRSARLRAVEAVEADEPDEPAGTRSGAAAGPAGTSNARRWRARCSASTSTFTAAARTCSFRTTRTRSRRAKARTGKPFVQLLDAQRLRAASTTRRCRSRSATSSPSARCWRNTTPKSCASSSCARITAAAELLRRASRRCAQGADAAVHGVEGRGSRPTQRSTGTKRTRSVSRRDGRRLQHAGRGRGAVRTRERSEPHARCSACTAIRKLAQCNRFPRTGARAFLQQAAGSNKEGGLDVAEIEARIAARVAAKQAKNYAEADLIRANCSKPGLRLRTNPAD